MRHPATVLVLSLASLLAACQSYTVPGKRADFEHLGLAEQQRLAAADGSVRNALTKKPLATFPATIAVARIQGGNYGHGYHGGTYGTGNYTLITTRDVETEDDFLKLAKLPRINALVPLKRIVVPRELKSDLELRTAAATLHADLILLYTFDTQFYTDDHVRALGVITLGLIPNQKAHVTVTASALLMDTANGYIYMVSESTVKDDQIANAWSSEQAMEETRRRAERQAFEALMSEVTREWPLMLATYDRPKPTP